MTVVKTSTNSLVEQQPVMDSQNNENPRQSSPFSVTKTEIQQSVLHRKNPENETQFSNATQQKHLTEMWILDSNPF